ncbi:MAG: hypothetical protein MI924_08330 [Chloroflexales bacterium]|nr:hypothetical protein [Chloroflexales bacterium]
MGTSYIEVNEQGFWMRDSILELWMRLVALHIEEPTEDDSQTRRIRDQWLIASRGYFNGCIPIDLNDDVSTEKGKQIIIDTINSVLNGLRQAPEALNKDVLNLLGITGAFIQDIETWRLIEVGEAFLDLIDWEDCRDGDEHELHARMRRKTEQAHGDQALT